MSKALTIPGERSPLAAEAVLPLGVIGGSLAAGGLVASGKFPLLSLAAVAGVGVAYAAKPDFREPLMDLFVLPALVGGAAVKVWKAVR